MFRLLKSEQYVALSDAATNQGWVGLALGSSKTLTQVKDAPRRGVAYRMTGGTIQGSSTADFSSGVTDLFNLSAAPSEVCSRHQSISGSYRHVRYLAPAGGYGNIAELEVHGNQALTYIIEQVD